MAQLELTPAAEAPAIAVQQADISVVTPSLNMLGYLKRCHASIQDQAGVLCEHIVVDGGSTDGTVEWLAEHHSGPRIVGKDAGMYDAINKGWAISSAPIVSYLNCDEQYLPGALSFVRAYFAEHDDVDVLVGGTLIVRRDGSMVTFKKAYRAISPFILCSHLYLFTSSMFLRRRVLEEGNYFDTRFKLVGDKELVLRLLQKRYRIATVRRFLSAFTVTGANMGLRLHSPREEQLIGALRPWSVARLGGAWRAAQIAYKFASGAYFQGGPIRYAVYTDWDTDIGGGPQRRFFQVRKASLVWRPA